MSTKIKRVQTPNKLESLLRALVAKDGNIDESEVTAEYVLKRRQKYIYPYKRFYSGSKKGGYNTRKLSVLTGQEIKELETIADNILESI